MYAANRLMIAKRTARHAVDMPPMGSVDGTGTWDSEAPPIAVMGAAMPETGGAIGVEGAIIADKDMALVSAALRVAARSVRGPPGRLLGERARPRS